MGVQRSERRRPLTAHGPFGESIEGAQHFRCAPGAVAGAVSELDDHAGLDKGTDEARASTYQPGSITTLL
jgi:hypothetical protein